MNHRLHPLLFRLDPERAHTYVSNLMRLAGGLPPLRWALRTWFEAPQTPVQAFGLTFSNPIGLAAGYDKDGLAWRGLACLGFGHIEIGTVTPLPQPGNPRPRLFRLTEDVALINRLGFPGKGASFLARRLARAKTSIPVSHPGLVLGVNLGKNAVTPLESAIQDYLQLMEVFAPLADYLAINVSSPNTPGLRLLQKRRAFEDLLAEMVCKRQDQTASLGRRVPLLVKLSPDLSDSELDDVLDVVLRLELDGVIAANTTIQREGLHSPLAIETGGLSGAPITERGTQMVRQIYQRTGGRLPIIGVGGIMKSQDAKARLDAGALLVQVYTGLIYSGPSLVRNILLSLKE
jgi:dihydroorotate dehydrogenase